MLNQNKKTANPDESTLLGLERKLKDQIKDWRKWRQTGNAKTELINATRGAR